MARRQMSIPGTERTEIPDVEKAAEAYRETRDERCELSKREAVKKAELLATMRANKVKKYRYHDSDGIELEAVIDDEPTVKVRKTSESDREPDEGGGVQVRKAPAPDMHQGLIDQALKSQDDANVEVDSSGDVQVPEKAAAKSRRGKGRKGK